MSRKDNSVPNESNYVGMDAYQHGENRAIYSQDIMTNRQLTSGGPMMSTGGPPMSSGGPAINTGPPVNSTLPLSRAPPMHSNPQLNAAPQLTRSSPMSSAQPVGGGPPLNSGPSMHGGPPLNSGPPHSSPLTTMSPVSSGQPLHSGPARSSPLNTMSPVSSGQPLLSGPPRSSPLNTMALVSSGQPLLSGPPRSSPLNTMAPVSSGQPLHTGPPRSSPLNPNPAMSTVLSRASPLNTNPAMSIVPPRMSPLNANPPVTSGPSLHSAPLLNSGPSLVSGPPITTRPLINSGPPSMNSGPSLNSGSSVNSGPPFNSGPPVASGPPLNSGPSFTSGPVKSSGPPRSSGPTLDSGPRIPSGPLLNSGPPITSGPLLNSGVPVSSTPMLNSGPPVSSGLLLNSGPSVSSGPILNSGPVSSGPPLNNRPPMASGPPLSTGPPLNRADASQGLSHPFQNINLSGGVPPHPTYQPEPQSQPNAMSPLPPQPYSATNRPLDMRSPNANYSNYSPYNNQMNNQNLNVTKAGFNKIWGTESIDLLQCRNILPPEKVAAPRIKLQQDLLDRVNCSPEIFRCTLTKIPDSNSLLQKARLPLGILIHPFKDLNHLPVIQCSTIVRCRSCRTYINPFVYFVDSKRWKCNLCYKVNELPEEFQFDPATKSYGDPSRRPEIRTSTIEFIAPSEYMLRPPQPAVYLFIFDVSRLAVESGYLNIVCNIVAEEMSRLPGDGRTQVGFLAVNSAIHFFSMQENVSQPHQMIMLDVDDVFLPCPENLIVNLKEREELIKDLLSQLPYMFKDSYDTNCALGAALQAAFKLMSPTGGRVTVFQLCLPNLGPGGLQPREDPNTRSSKDVPYLNPATDFYKRLALDCSGQQVAVDLFLLNCQYSDLATLSGICKFSGGCIYYLPLFQASKLQHVEALDKMLRRYLTRKIGFEAVMRIRCTRGLSIHTFHGNFFVRSTDLLSLPNINPDAGFGMQVTIEENLSEMQTVCFQAALLYTSSKGERRIRVHTLCLPITSSLSDVVYSADQQCIIGLLAKMAVDRSLQSSLSDAREALINAAVDALSSYKLLQGFPCSGLTAPQNLKLLPMYIIALLKCKAFRFGVNTRLDDRVFAMCQLKSLPLCHLIQMIYPDMYAVHDLVTSAVSEVDGELSPQPERLHLSAEKLDSQGVFLLDAGDQILIYVGKNVHPSFCYNILGVSSFAAIPEEMYGLPELTTPESERLRTFVATLQDEKPWYATTQVIRDDGHFRTMFTERLIEDRFENALSYYEFLQHIKTQIK